MRPATRNGHPGDRSTVAAGNYFALEFGQHGSDTEFLLEGWAGPESGLRWAVGAGCALRVGPVAGVGYAHLSAVLTPAPCREKTPQIVVVLVNDALAARLEVIRGCHEYAVLIEHALFRADQSNTIRFLFRYSVDPGEIRDTERRRLAVAFHRLSLDRSRLRFFTRPRLLPPGSEAKSVPAERPGLAERFQSLGQNCEFGLVQRRFGAEPHGLLRFASISLNRLLLGVRTQFSGIADPDNLTLRLDRPNGEYIGHHKIYGLDYHTFRRTDQVDPESFHRKESARLGFLAKMLMDQIRLADKIFVVKRTDPTLALEHVLPLFATLRTYNADVRLLYVTSIGRDYPYLIGRSEQLCAGLFHGFIERFAPNQNAHNFSFDPWLKICASVADAVPS